MRSQKLASDLETDLENGPAFDKNEASRLQTVLQSLIEAGTVCQICDEVPAEARMTDCEHIYCKKWFVPLLSLLFRSRY